MRSAVVAQTVTIPLVPYKADRPAPPSRVSRLGAPPDTISVKPVQRWHVGALPSSGATRCGDGDPQSWEVSCPQCAVAPFVLCSEAVDDLPRHSTKPRSDLKRKRRQCLAP